MNDEQEGATPEEDPSRPMSWLWQEIARRFGKEEADALHQDYLARMRVYQRRLEITRFRREIPGIEHTIARRKAAGKSTIAAEKRLALRRARLQEAESEGDTREE